MDNKFIALNISNKVFNEETYFERCNISYSTFNVVCHFDRCNIINCAHTENCDCIKSNIIFNDDHLIINDSDNNLNNNIEIESTDIV
jgi:hypothetical protein